MSTLWLAVRKLDPRVQVGNPVMFVVWLGTVFTAGLAFWSRSGYDAAVAAILLATVLFANLAEAVAEGRGRAQAAALKSTKADAPARRRAGDGWELVPAAALRRGDVVRIAAGEAVPADGEVLEGVAAVDESAITGESAPVLKEPGTDVASSVIGGTKLVSDWLVVRITSDPGESFLDKMIALVEGASRQKTPNEVALGLLLTGLTLVFMLVVATLPAFAAYAGLHVGAATLVALLVCLIPTTIGGLLSAIGIAGMDRVARFNVIATSGRAVEAAGDVDVLILDKTGTITFGNRMAAAFLPVGGTPAAELARVALATSWHDGTPEGRSVVALATSLGAPPPPDGTGLDFSAETRMSGTDWPDGRVVRKGAADAVKRYVQALGGAVPADLDAAVRTVAEAGGTPLAVAEGAAVLGVIHLKDTIKPGMRERFARMRAMGIKTIMCTGDNPVTARVIAEEAGVDDYLAEARPEDKIALIRREQAKGSLVAMTGDGTNDAPALAQADVGLAMNAGTAAAKEAANMVDLDSDPTKLIDVVGIGKQLLITRGALTTFSVANDVAKYFAILPAIFALPALDLMRLSGPQGAIVSALLFNALIIPALIPVALRGVRFAGGTADQLLARNVAIYGVGGLVAPFVGIKAIDLVVGRFL